MKTHTVTIVVCKKKSFILVYFKYLFIFKFQAFINKKNQSNIDIVGQLTKQCVLFKEILRIFAMVLKRYFPYFIF